MLSTAIAPRFGDEDEPMTMQVVLLCNEGLVFAGDLRQTETTSQGKWVPNWRGYLGTKIKTDGNEKIYIACARNMDYARQIADALIADLIECEPTERGRRILTTGEKMAAASNDPLGAECIVMFAAPQPSFFHLRVDSYGKCSCYVGINRSIAGDTGNPANFWAERYHTDTLSIPQLTHLAAHMIVDGGKISCGNIDGLEIIIATDGKFIQWTDEDNRNLEAKIKAEALTIGGIVLGGVPL